MKYLSSAIRGIAVASFVIVIYNTVYQFWFSTSDLLVIFCMAALQGLISRIIKEKSFFPDLLNIIINAISSYVLAFATILLIGDDLKGWNLLKFTWVWLLIFVIVFFYSYISNRKQVDELNKRIERIKF